MVWKNLLKFMDEHLKLTEIFWKLSSDGKESVRVSKWLNDLINDPKKSIILDIIIDEHNLEAIKDQNGNFDDDATLLMLLNWVRNNITYVSDIIQYKKVEFWANPLNTYMNKKGDCEDGAILIFCLARKLGVSEAKIKLVAGNVAGGGHCWVAYKSDNWPFVWYFFDWCYLYSGIPIPKDRYDKRRRESFLINDNKITHGTRTFKDGKELKPKYYYIDIWFLADDKKGMKGVSYE